MSNEEKVVSSKSKDIEKQVANLAFIVRKMKDWLEEKMGADIDGDGRIGSGSYNKVKKVLSIFFILGLASVCLSAPHNTNIAVWYGSEAAPKTYIDQTGNFHAPSITVSDFIVNTNINVAGNVNVAGKVGVGETLAVTGIATLVKTPVLLDGLTVQTNATVGGTLGVTGIASFTATPLCRNGLTVNTNATVGGTLGVTGVATLTATPLLLNGLNVRTNAIVGGTLVVTSSVTASSFSGNGFSLTSLNGTNVGAGVPVASVVGEALVKTTTFTGGGVTGKWDTLTVSALPAISGFALTSINGTNVGAGIPSANLSGSLPAISGFALTSINGTNVGAGVPAASVAGTALTQSSTFSGGVTGVYNTLTVASLPAISGAALTGINATNVVGNLALGNMPTAGISTTAVFSSTVSTMTLYIANGIVTNTSYVGP